MAIGGLISYGIGRMDNLGMAQWRWIMLILGGVTCVVGIFAFFFLIDNPRSKYLRLNAESDILVENRTRDNAVVRTTVIKKDHIIEALKEVRLWAYCFATMLFCLSGGLDFYSAQIIHSFGFSNLQSVLLSIPNGALDIFFIMLSVYLSNKYNQNIYVACAMLCIGNIGSLLIVVIPNPKYKLIGQYLGWAAVSAYVLLLASISNNVSGYTKKIFYNSMMMVSYTIGNFIGPFVMAPEFAPRFVPSLVIYMCANVVGGFLLLIVRWRMAAVNRRRLANPSGTVTQVEDNLTDTQDPNFIYRL
ncbi:hypothetical protein DFQ30_004398 [Apophysomyces sp. BC1015]|nr:hypothetical protein DFQ30_004398 [Apophysomyces sp. BC1015]KAG0179518.1 hypothetical protein DFQ29_002025 [Apophysomyces sp. BC1021]